MSNCGTSNYVDLFFSALRSRTSTYMDKDTSVYFSKKKKKKFHEYFGAVDINNHHRHGSIAFERGWKTEKFHHRFFMTILGVCITNFSNL